MRMPPVCKKGSSETPQVKVVLRGTRSSSSISSPASTRISPRAHATKHDVGATKQDAGSTKQNTRVTKQQDVGNTRLDACATKQGASKAKRDAQGTKQDASDTKQDACITEQDAPKSKKDTGSNNDENQKKTHASKDKEVLQTSSQSSTTKHWSSSRKSNLRSTPKTASSSKQIVENISEDSQRSNVRKSRESKKNSQDISNEDSQVKLRRSKNQVKTSDEGPLNDDEDVSVAAKSVEIVNMGTSEEVSCKDWNPDTSEQVFNSPNTEETKLQVNLSEGTKESDQMVTIGTQTQGSPFKRKLSPTPNKPSEKRKKMEVLSPNISPRKSSRQSKMSKWYEDMEVDFGKGKEKKQKTPEHNTMSENKIKQSKKKSVEIKRVKTEKVIATIVQEIAPRKDMLSGEDSVSLKPPSQKDKPISQQATVQDKVVKSDKTVVTTISVSEQERIVQGLATVSEVTISDQSGIKGTVKGGSTEDSHCNEETLISETANETMRETIQQSMGESIQHSMAETVHQSMDETVHQSMGETVHQSMGETVHQSMGETVHQSMGETIQQSMGESIQQSKGETVQHSMGGTIEQPGGVTVDQSKGVTLHDSTDHMVISSGDMLTPEGISQAELLTSTTTLEDNVEESEANLVREVAESYNQLTYTSVVVSDPTSTDPLRISVDVQTEPNNTHTKTQEFVIVRLPEGTPIQNDLSDKQKIAEEDAKCEFNVDAGTFRCLECNYLTAKKANWYKHKKKHCAVKAYACDSCDYKSSTSSNLKRHMGIHRDIRKHGCHRCGLMFRQKIHLERHIKYKHEVKSVQCPLCDYVCANENPDLKIHIKRKHDQLKDKSQSAVYTCQECGMISVSKKDFKQHQKFHKKGPELKLFCETCSFVTDCDSRMARHMVTHTKEKPFQCGMCDYRATQKEHVIRHIKTQHNIEIPEKSRSSNRDSSTSDTAGMKLNEDSLSNSPTPSSYDLDKKYEKADFSTKDKIFACNHCTMKFAKLINLYKHLHSQHKNIMPDAEEEFSCVVCEFRTNSKKNLLVHMRKHNLMDQSPPSHVYSCVLCNYVNPKRRNLFQHMKKKHKIEIVMKDDGSANCFIAENSNLTAVESKNENLMTVGDVVTASTTDNNHFHIVSGADNLQRLVSISDLANAIALPQNTDGVVYIDHSNGNKAVTEMDLGDLQMDSISAQDDAAQAIQGLQALAEQGHRQLLEASVTEESLREIHPETSMEIGDEILTEQVVEAHPSVEGEEMLETQQVIEESAMIEHQTVVENPEQVIEMSDSACVMEIGEEGISTETEEDRPSIQLSPEQLMNLSSGDYVEINGEMYKVEFSTEHSV